jgi:tRNA (cmo5U34)-methyltransferase
MNKFSFDTVKDFDNHINNSIKGYDLLDYLILNLCSFFIKEETVIIDLGCTTGRLLDKINKKYNSKCIGFDLIDNQFIKDTNCELIKQDITNIDFILPKSNIILSVFTLQFIDINKRVNVLKKVYDSLTINGAFIFCEKEICNDGVIQECFTFSNYDNKKQSFTAEEILSKEVDLRKLMNNLNSNQNIELLKESGFKIIEPFFQSLNFKGYICRK